MSQPFVNFLTMSLTGDVKSPALKRVQLMAAAMYRLCGMPFVDLQHLNIKSVVDGILKYNRHKTGTSVNTPVNKIFAN